MRIFGQLLLLTILGCSPVENASDPREEVVFWHFWGGRDRPVVEEIVQRFNASQDRYRVRAVAMPGANLDLKFFLSVAGGDPPDLLNQDDPIVADWAARGALTPLNEIVAEQELKRLGGWLFPAARRLGEYDGQTYAVANGLDIRALFVNKALLDEHGLPVPRTIADLDQIATALTPGTEGRLRRVGYLPDPRRLWAWGAVFGGRFYDPKASDPRHAITCDAPEIVATLCGRGR